MTATRRVLVTGSSRGIGRATAIRLASEGYLVTIHGRAPSAAMEETAAHIRKVGGQSTSLTFDVTDREASRVALLEDVEQHGACWGVVVNAGVTRDAAFPALTGEEWDLVIDTAINGFFHVIHPLIMPMIRLRCGGRIVVLSSASGVMGNRGQVNYSAAKAGLIGAVKALAVELASRRITVNAVAPGLIGTEMADQLEKSGALNTALSAIPMGRVGTVEEVAGLIAYLMREEAAYLTRQVLSINGGLC